MDACKTALGCGYRHIDTAHAYQNERSVGRAVRESGIPRDEIWITSKLWPSEYGQASEAIDRMLKRLDTDHIDLLLLHQQVGDYMKAWRDMEGPSVTEGPAASASATSTAPGWTTSCPTAMSRPRSCRWNAIRSTSRGN